MRARLILGLVIVAGCGEVDESGAASADAGIDAAIAPVACTAGDNRVVDPGTGHCYMWFSTPVVSWMAARDACVAVASGAHLVTITSDGENAILTTVATDRMRGLWIGLADDATESDYRWLTGEPYGFAAWGTSEPNNGVGDFEEDCVEASVTDAAPRWNDAVCDWHGNGYVCELEGSVVLQ